MSHINLKYMQAAEERLLKQVQMLQALREETVRTEEKIKHMAYVDKARLELAKSRESLDENIRVLLSMAKVLGKVQREYQKTESRITDRYNLDTAIYPETRFGTSKITGMEKYQALMPF